MNKKPFFIKNSKPKIGSLPKNIMVRNRHTVDTSRIKEDDLGYMRFAASILSIGSMNYGHNELFPDDPPSTDIIEIHITEEMLSDWEVENSFEMRPVTLHHPENIVQAENFTEFAVGFSGGVYFDQSHLATRIAIFDPVAKQSILDGKTLELSTGFVANVVLGDDGRLYFENIRGDHIALVENGTGRCGKSCSIHYSLNSNHKRGKRNMAKVTLLGGASVEIEDDNAASLVTNAINTLSDDNSAVRSKNEALEQKIIELEKNQMDQSKIDGAIKVINELLKKMPPKYDSTGKSVIEIKRDVVKNCYPNIDVSDKSEHSLDAMIETISEFKNASINTNMDDDGDNGEMTHEQRLFEKQYGKKGK